MTAAARQVCHRIFSGIQPTGVPHLGNYFGAVAQWQRIASDQRVPFEGRIHNCDTPIFAIVDVHAYSSSKFGPQLYDHILATTASLLALGLEPSKCILFRQSDLFEHNFLANVLDNFVAPGRLTHMTQFKDKSRGSNQLITNGLLNYPVLQAADILLYRATLVPVGEDQLQHIELTRDIARKFNSCFGRELFPEPRALLGGSEHARRIKSLRDPSRKMSKSDPAGGKSFIEIVDEPDVIVEKCKKALTDGVSAVSYEPDTRPGVANLMRIYHLTTGQSLEFISQQCRSIEIIDFKLMLATALIDRFRPVREEFKRLRADEAHLEQVLRLGAERARSMAAETVAEVRNLLGSIKTDTGGGGGG